MTEIDCHPPSNIAKNFTANICIAKCNACTSRLLILGFLAGAFISFGAMLSLLAGHDSAGYLGFGLSRIISGAVFSTGLMMVVVAGAELFTGNNLILMSLMDKKIPLKKLLRNWFLVYVANFAGALFIAILFYYSGIWGFNHERLGSFTYSVAVNKVNLTFAEALVRGILCNWLVCLAVWMSTASRSVIGKIFAVMFPIMTFVALGFEHSIANMFFIPAGILVGQEPVITEMSATMTQNLTQPTFANLWLNNLIPVTLGNIIGGAFFVGFLYWFVFVRGDRQNNQC